MAEPKATTCSECNTEFGFFRKEAKCRLCGAVVCSKCNSTKTTLRSGVTVESCGACAEKLEDEQRVRQEREDAENMRRALELEAKLEQKLSRPSKAEQLIAKFDAMAGKAGVDPSVATFGKVPPPSSGSLPSNQPQSQPQIQPARRAPPPLPPTRGQPPPLPPRGSSSGPPRKSGQAAANDSEAPASASSDGADDHVVLPDVPNTAPRIEGAGTAATGSSGDLESRIQRLRGPTKPVPEADDLAERLARLTGKPNILKPKAPGFQMPADTRTDEEKINDMLSQAAEQAALEGGDRAASGSGGRSTAAQLHDEEEHDTDEEVEKMMARLADLKKLGLLDEDDAGEKKGSSNRKHSDATPSSRSKVNKPAPRGRDSSGDESGSAEEDYSDEELPWCMMCNDDATVRCPQCDELYCKACYKEVHRDRDMRHHTQRPYQRPSKTRRRRS